MPGLNVAKVEVAKVDSYQGREKKFVIFDTVVASQIGFLREPGRLNVGLSRARDGLWIICNAKGLEDACKKTRKAKAYVGEVVNYCKGSRGFYTIENQEVDKYIDDMAEMYKHLDFPTDFYDVDPSNADDPSMIMETGMFSFPR